MPGNINTFGHRGLVPNGHRLKKNQHLLALNLARHKPSISDQLQPNPVQTIPTLTFPDISQTNFKHPEPNNP